MTDPHTADVVVLGGGAAGSTAALVLARARHRVIVADDATYRNRTVAHFHGFPGRDHTPPAAFLADAHDELRRYGVEQIATPVTAATSRHDRLQFTFADGRCVAASAAVVATGVRDELPPIDGLVERWGRSAFNCPFCDGWERRDRPVVVIDDAPGAEHLAALLRSWTSRVTVVAADQVVALAGPSTRLEHVHLRDGSTIDAAAVFVKSAMTPRSNLARALGCTLDDGFVVTDADGATDHPRVWAAGDVRRRPPSPHQVVLAAADGSAAAIAIHKAFVDGRLRTLAS